MSGLFPAIDPASEIIRQRAQAALDNKTKPLGSLGRLEELAAQLCAIQGRIPAATARKRVVVFAGDHGVTSAGTSAYPQEVTAQMVANFAAGGAAVNVLARQAGAELEVVDVGVASACDPRVLDRKIRRGTRNLAEEPAMTVDEAKRAIAVGLERALAAAAAGIDVLALGEMGIGNTTSASVLLGLLTGAEPDVTVGRGTGLDDARLEHKRSVVAQAVALHAPSVASPFDALRVAGGLEIGALAGAMLGAASSHVAVVVDGFICTVAALLAMRLVPTVRDYMVFGHRSPETGHTVALQALGARPLLDLGMRLGEGSGAVLALHVVESAGSILREMASFAEAGVSTATTTT